MSERAEVSFDAALMMALRADAQKELDELPSPAQLKERYPDTSRWDARLQAALHKRRPVLKRVLVAALTLVILTLGALAVSADFRKAVYTMIQKFLPIELEAFAVAVDRYLHIVVIKTSCAVEIILHHATHRYVESQLRKHLKAYIYLTSSTIHHYNIRKTVDRKSVV